MSKKDYIKLARALLDVRNSYGKNWDANLFRACDDHARSIADVLAERGQFDRQRFLTACGVTA